MEHDNAVHAVQQPVVGIETSKLRIKAVLLRHAAGAAGGATEEMLCKVLENDLAGHRWLRSWLQKNGVETSGLRICMRLDGPDSESAARSLALMGMQVCEARPDLLEQFARQQGFDSSAGGAALLARYGACASLPRWIPPTPAYTELRLWLSRLEAIQAVRKQEVLRLEQHLAAGQQALHGLLLQQIACLDLQIVQHEAVIVAHIRRHPNLDKPPELARRGQRVARLEIGMQAGAAPLH